MSIELIKSKLFEILENEKDKDRFKIESLIYIVVKMMIILEKSIYHGEEKKYILLETLGEFVKRQRFIVDNDILELMGYIDNVLPPIIDIMISLNVREIVIKKIKKWCC